MRPTRPALLVATIVAAAVLSLLVVRAAYADLPPLPTSAPASLVVVAVLELASARAVRARLRGRPGTRPIDPLVVARFAALARASSLAGALVTGVYAGWLGHVVRLSGELAAARDDLPVAVAGMIAALLLMAAALVLERVCRVPGPPPGPR